MFAGDNTRKGGRNCLCLKTLYSFYGNSCSQELGASITKYSFLGRLS